MVVLVQTLLQVGIHRVQNLRYQSHFMTAGLRIHYKNFVVAEVGKVLAKDSHLK